MSSLLNKSATLSGWALLLIFLFLGFQRITDKKWKPKEHAGSTQLSFDSFGYYLYLPSAFIYHDFDNLAYLKEILPKYKPTTDFSQAVEGPEGRYVNKYTMGQAILFTPFFLIAHYIAAPLGGFEQDGFSPPYQFSVAVGCLIYTFIGLYFLRKSLLRFFNDRITAAVLVLVALGTNFILFSTRDITMPHNQLFAVFSLLLYLTIQYYEKPGSARAIYIGLLIGLAGLIRPTEVIIGIVPVLWGIGRGSEIPVRIRNHGKNIILMMVFSFLVFALQLIYWKIQSGRWLFYSYGNESLNLMNPHIFEVLFSFRKGLFVYTPVMLFALAGFIALYRFNRGLFFPVIIFTILNMWIISSWDCWWYGGCFGQRAMIQSYVLASLPLGYLLLAINRMRSTLLQGSAFLTGLCLVMLNLFQSWQYKNGIIHYEGMTKQAYFAVFGKLTTPEGFNNLLSEPDYSHYRPQKGVTFEEHVQADENFDTMSSAGLGFESPGSMHSDPQTQFSPTWSFNLESLKFSPEFKVRCTFKLFTKEPLRQSSLVMTVESKGEPAYIYKSLELGMLSHETGKWHDVEMWMDVPKYVGPDDQLKVYIWNRGDGELYIDNFRILLQKRMYL